MKTVQEAKQGKQKAQDMLNWMLTVGKLQPSVTFNCEIPYKF